MVQLKRALAKAWIAVEEILALLFILLALATTIWLPV